MNHVLNTCPITQYRRETCVFDRDLCKCLCVNRTPKRCKNKTRNFWWSDRFDVRGKMITNDKNNKFIKMTKIV